MGLNTRFSTRISGAGWKILPFILALSGCATATEEGGPDRTLNGASGTGGTLPAAGMSASGAGGGDDLFGNTTAPPPVMNVPPPEEECLEGMRCHENTIDEDDCGKQILESTVETIEKPGNVLLVFDRSGSMAQEWNGQPRWEAAGAAIENALTPLLDKLTVGSVFFPSSDPNAPLTCVDPTGITCLFVPGLMVAGGTCGVTDITSPDQIAFVAGAGFMTAFSGGAAPLYAPIPGGFTPLKEGLQQAQMALAAAPPEGITSVIVITDGDPNCEWDAAVSQQIVTDWQAAGINTYVIGLPGTTGTGDAILNNLAMAGGTGTYITPNDAAGLEMKLREIATETVAAGIDSCVIQLVPPAEAPDKLHLVVTEGGMDQDAPRDLGNGAGWTLSADASTVTLEGAFCDEALTGRFSSLRFEFGCVDLPPLPPIKPPE